jgi:hypothetical protein
MQKRNTNTTKYFLKVGQKPEGKIHIPTRNAKDSQTPKHHGMIKYVRPQHTRPNIRIPLRFSQSTGFLNLAAVLLHDEGKVCSCQGPTDIVVYGVQDVTDSDWSEVHGHSNGAPALRPVHQAWILEHDGDAEVGRGRSVRLQERASATAP